MTYENLIKAINKAKYIEIWASCLSDHVRIDKKQLIAKFKNKNQNEESGLDTAKNYGDHDILWISEVGNF